MSTEIDERVYHVKNIHAAIFREVFFPSFFPKNINELFNRLDNRKPSQTLVHDSIQSIKMSDKNFETSKRKQGSNINLKTMPFSFSWWQYKRLGNHFLYIHSLFHHFTSDLLPDKVSWNKTVRVQAGYNSCVSLRWRHQSSVDDDKWLNFDVGFITTNDYKRSLYCST